MGHMMGLPLPQVLHMHPLLLACLQLALVIPILILNRNYFTVGFSRLVKLSPNMDSLVSALRLALYTASLKWACWPPDRYPVCRTCTSSPPA